MCGICLGPPRLRIGSYPKGPEASRARKCSKRPNDCLTTLQPVGAPRFAHREVPNVDSPNLILGGVAFRHRRSDSHPIGNMHRISVEYVWSMYAKGVEYAWVGYVSNNVWDRHATLISHGWNMHDTTTWTMTQDW